MERLQLAGGPLKPCASWNARLNSNLAPYHWVSKLYLERQDWSDLQAEFQSISRERSDIFVLHELIELGSKLENSNRYAAALHIYRTALSEALKLASPDALPLQQLAKNRIASLAGANGSKSTFELYFREFKTQTLNPLQLGGVFAGAWLGAICRLGGRYLKSSLFGLGAEIATLTGLQTFLSPPGVKWSDLLLKNTLSLGALKLVSITLRGLNLESKPFSPIYLAGQFGSVFIAHKLTEFITPKDKGDRDLFLRSLFLIAQNQLSHHLLRKWLPHPIEFPQSHDATKLRLKDSFHAAAAQAGSSSKSGNYALLPYRLIKAIHQLQKTDGALRPLTMHALQRLFQYDALNTAQGTWNNALWQNFLNQAMMDPFTSRGNQAILAALSIMEQVPKPESIRTLSRRFKYQRATIPSSEFERIKDKLLKISTIQGFPKHEIESALQLAQESPHASVMLKRLRSIIVENRAPYKIREFFRADPVDTPSFLRTLSAAISRNSIADLIRGTAHNAYQDDVRLARKVVSVYEEITPILKNPNLRAANLSTVREIFKWAFKQNPGVDAGTFIAFLGALDDEQAQALSYHLRARKLRIELLDGNQFEFKARKYGLPSSCRLAMYLKPVDPELPNIIVLRSMKEHLGSGPETLFEEFTDRIVATFHEFEHYRHFTGNFDRRESKSTPFHMVNMTPQDTLLSETMAILEQLRWRIKYLDDDFYQVAQRLGDNLPQLALSMAEFSQRGKSPSNPLFEE